MPLSIKRSAAALLVLLLAFTTTKILYADSVTYLEPQELYNRSDLVVLGEIIGLDRTADSTRAQLRVLQAFKGPMGLGSMVTVESLGGKVFIEEGQPSFMTAQVNLLFLQKTTQGTYMCTNQADGQKLIRNKNLYPYHDNFMYSVPLEDYLKVLQAFQSGLQEKGVKPASP